MDLDGTIFFFLSFVALSEMNRAMFTSLEGVFIPWFLFHILLGCSKWGERDSDYVISQSAVLFGSL